MENKLLQIKDLLLQKSSAKQKAFRTAKEVFELFKISAKKIANELYLEMAEKDPHVEVKYYEKSEYEIHLKFSGDTLVLMMHTNIFEFEPNHYIHQSEYVKEDRMRGFCGMIQVYNFLADSIKYNREGDLGYLVGRIFINKDNHLMVDGKRPLSLRYSDLGTHVSSIQITDDILSESILYCINFDLIVPPFEAMSYITLEQKNMMSFSSGMPTGKMLGFLNQTNQETDA